MRVDRRRAEAVPAVARPSAGLLRRADVKAALDMFVLCHAISRFIRAFDICLARWPICVLKHFPQTRLPLGRRMTTMCSVDLPTPPERQGPREAESILDRRSRPNCC